VGVSSLNFFSKDEGHNNQMGFVVDVSDVTMHGYICDFLKVPKSFMIVLSTSLPFC